MAIDIKRKVLNSVVRPLLRKMGYSIKFTKISANDPPPSKYQNMDILKSGAYTFKTLTEYGPMGLLYMPKGYQKLIERLGNEKFSEIRFNNCIDLGAHHGSFSCWIASLGIPTVAVEADADNFQLLKENSQNLKHLSCIHAAIVGINSLRLINSALFTPARPQQLAH